MNKNAAVILAGGQGTRMKSDKPKVMAEVLFKPMIDWVIDAAKEAGIEDICVVTGYRADLLETHLAGRTSGDGPRRHEGKTIHCRPCRCEHSHPQR